MKNPYHVVREINGIELKEPCVSLGEYEEGYIQLTDISAVTLADVLNAAYQRGVRAGARGAGKAMHLVAGAVESDYQNTSMSLVDDAAQTIRGLRSAS